MRRLALALTFVLLSSVTRPAEAQVVATLRWQTQPYCNVLTLTFAQQGGMYQVTGTDDLCGAGVATVTGTAVPAATSVVTGLTVNLPTGAAAHLTVPIRVSDASGSWSDADGNTGVFALNAATGGSPRPVPAGSTAITVTQFSPTVYGGTGTSATVARSDHDHDVRYYTKALTSATFAANTRLLSAVVDRAGVLLRGSQATASARTGTGQYTVTFTRAVDTCAATATQGGSGASAVVGGEVVTLHLAPNVVTVLTSAVNVGQFDLPFSLTVICP